MNEGQGQGHEEIPEGWGEENYSGSKYERFRLKPADDSIIVRIFGPMKSMVQSGRVSVYGKKHFGPKIRSDRDPSRFIHKPVLCIEEKRDGMVTCECGLCRNRKVRLDKIETIKSKGKELGKTSAEIAKAMTPHSQWLRDHGLDAKMYYLGMNKGGQYGVLEIPYGLAKKFDNLRRELAQKGHTPSGDKGIWFEFTRTGKASPQSDNVTPLRITKTLNGEQVEVIDTHFLTKEIKAQALEVLPDLGKLFDSIRVTPAQIEALATCSEDPDEVAAILGIEKKQAVASADVDDTDWSGTPTSGVDVASVEDDDFGSEPAAPPAKPASAAKAAPAPEEDEEAALERQLAAARAKKVAAANKPTTATKAKPATVPGSVDPTTMADEDFDALFKNKTQPSA